MKAVLLSIRPMWCELIASGKKTIEVRKTRPKLQTPFKCYIYQGKTGYVSKSKENDIFVPATYGKVIGEFVCDKIYQYATGGVKGERGVDISAEDMASMSCLTCRQLEEYEYSSVPDEGYGLIGIYGWHISDLVIYGNPKEPSEFECLQKTRFGYAPYKITRPPQSWCYVEVSE